MRRDGKLGLIVALVAGIGAVAASQFLTQHSVAAEPPAPAKPAVTRTGVAKLVDLGSKECIPCKLMAPILDELKKDFAGKLDVKFVDVAQRVNLPVARKYRLATIPTQVFLDANGRELSRHRGFISRYGILDTFRALGYAFAEEALKPRFVRMEPAKADGRSKDRICFLCDGDLDPKSTVVVKTGKGDVKLCSPHCYFIMLSCLIEDKTGFEKKVSVTDYATGELAAATDAVYLYGLDERTGRPRVRAFAGRAAAEKQQRAGGGSILGYDVLKGKELVTRCGFCDRAAYPEDAAVVRVAGVYTWGCCSHCAMGVAARTGGDVEVRQPDRLTGEMVVVRTFGGYVLSLEPKTAVAWLGLRKKPDGSYGSAGCFHQGFFTSEENLKKWIARAPHAVGKMISIDQALADKMKLSRSQIAKACKIGECAPK